jgi:bifunctional DNA-binding transcriptional regulator/antitoxin component of YhaV-PrlF toxin-antitoxin module
MKIRNVTITSKNQITLPSEYVKSLGLNKSRVLRSELKEGKIVLTPQAPLNDVMKQFWSKHSVHKTVSDKELKQAAHEIASKRATRTDA